MLLLLVMLKWCMFLRLSCSVSLVLWGCILSIMFVSDCFLVGLRCWLSVRLLFLVFWV